KPAPAHNVRGQPEIDNIEHVEELGAKFHVPKFRVPAMSKGSVFDQRDVIVVKIRPPERIAPQRAKAALVRPRPARNVDRNIEERSVIRAQTKIVVAYRPAGGEMRQRNQVRPVRSAQTSPGLLYARVNAERRSGG